MMTNEKASAFAYWNSIPHFLNAPLGCLAYMRNFFRTTWKMVEELHPKSSITNLLINSKFKIQ